MTASRTYKRIHSARRLFQTPRAFRNWPEVLRDIALERVGRGPQTLSFQTRSGLRIECPNRPGARVPLYEIFAEDSYRLGWWLQGVSRRPLRVVDVGGHVGTFACQLAHRFPKAELMTFEPSPTTATFLRRNVEQNGFAGRVQVYEQAVAGSAGRALFADNGAGSGLNGLTAAGHMDGQAVEVRTVTFREVLDRAPTPVDVVKIDCEGGEYDLIAEADASCWASVQRAVIEYHPLAGHGWPELQAQFSSAGLHAQDHLVSNGYGCVWLSREPLATFRR